MCVFVCVPWEKKCKQNIHLKVHECMNTEVFVLCARHNSGLQLAFFPFAYLSFKMLSVCMFVCLMNESSHAAAPDVNTQLYLHAQECN